MHQQDPEIPNGSVWQNKRFHQQYRVVGFIPICNRYLTLQVFPEWVYQYHPRNEDGTLHASPNSPEWIKTMRRAK